jgi:hypothetical protein
MRISPKPISKKSRTDYGVTSGRPPCALSRHGRTAVRLSRSGAPIDVADVCRGEAGVRFDRSERPSLTRAVKPDSEATQVPIGLTGAGVGRNGPVEVQISCVQVYSTTTCPCATFEITPMPLLTERVFSSSFDCQTKCYLLLNRRRGQKTEYEMHADESDRTYQREEIAKLRHCPWGCTPFAAVIRDIWRSSSYHL